jgi:hypothetical protein
MNKEFTLIFQRYDQQQERMVVVPSEVSIQETCESLRELLGLSHSSLYRLGIQRNGKVIDDNLTFESAGAQQNDRITLIPVNLIEEWQSKHYVPPDSTDSKNAVKAEPSSAAQAKSGNEYQILITTQKNKETHQYSVILNATYENNPLNFFEIPDGQEAQNFKEFIKKALEKELSDSALNKILRDWCKEISHGYRTFSLHL